MGGNAGAAARSRAEPSECSLCSRPRGCGGSDPSCGRFGVCRAPTVLPPDETAHQGRTCLFPPKGGRGDSDASAHRAEARPAHTLPPTRPQAARAGQSAWGRLPANASQRQKPLATRRASPVRTLLLPRSRQRTHTAPQTFAKGILFSDTTRCCLSLCHTRPSPLFRPPRPPPLSRRRQEGRRGERERGEGRRRGRGESSNKGDGRAITYNSGATCP